MAVGPVTLSHPQQQKLRLDEVQQEHGVRGFQPISDRPGRVQRERCECKSKQDEKGHALNIRAKDEENVRIIHTEKSCQHLELIIEFTLKV